MRACLHVSFVVVAGCSCVLRVCVVFPCVFLLLDVCSCCCVCLCVVFACVCCVGLLGCVVSVAFVGA